MKTIRKTIEVRVTREYNNNGTDWHLFAAYPNRLESFEALARAKEQGYKRARIVEIETVLL